MVHFLVMTNVEVPGPLWAVPTPVLYKKGRQASHREQASKQGFSVVSVLASRFFS